MITSAAARAPRIYAPEWTRAEVGDFQAEGAVSGDSLQLTRAPRKASPKTLDNPQVGQAAPAPRLTAGALKSPVFLGSEQAYFAEARHIIEQAQKGDTLAVQMYEFENVETNGDKDAAQNAPGFADQQALLPGLAEAAARGVQVEVVLDASKNPKTGELMNQPVADYLIAAGKKSGNLTLDFYPPNAVNIDHAKELIHLRPDGQAMAVQEALVGGSNWGNHTPANDDGGGAFYGRDAVGAAQIFFRDQAFARGDVSSPASPDQDPNAPVSWAVTSPTMCAGGSTGIKEAKLNLMQQADEIYLNQFCLNNSDLVAAAVAKGPAVHARLDPNEVHVNRDALTQIRQAGGQALWANTMMDANMPGQKNHEKLDVYVKDGTAFAATLGSANDTGNGLETTHYSPSSTTGKNTQRKTNHEIDAIVRRVQDGSYSTAAFLDAALAKTKTDLEQRSLEKPPSSLSGTAPGEF
ncbi:hypothetical protein JST97_38570 [bacterium]|nr:hypothetical protein [bacterium]